MVPEERRRQEERRLPVGRGRLRLLHSSRDVWCILTGGPVFVCLRVGSRHIRRIHAYMHIHTCTHAHIHTCTHTHMLAYTHARMHTWWICTHARAYMQVKFRLCIFPSLSCYTGVNAPLNSARGAFPVCLHVCTIRVTNNTTSGMRACVRAWGTFRALACMSATFAHRMRARYLKTKL